MAQPVLIKAFSTASHVARHPVLKPAHLPPIPPFMLAQNLPSKRIAPTDNMRPKLHDEYTRQCWLKG